MQYSSIGASRLYLRCQNKAEKRLFSFYGTYNECIGRNPGHQPLISHILLAFSIVSSLLPYSEDPMSPLSSIYNTRVTAKRISATYSCTYISTGALQALYVERLNNYEAPLGTLIGIEEV